jgi:BNR repeat-like domain
MPDDPRIRHLVEEVLESKRTPEEVCSDTPDLVAAVRKRLQQVQLVGYQLDEMFPAEGWTKHEDVPALKPDIELPVISGYEVEEVLGRGGMGIVFRARQLRLNRLVAVKMAIAGAYACDHRVRDPKTLGSHIIYSDDHGKTWKCGARVTPDCNECQVAELADGSLMLNMRSYHKKNRRAVAISKDGGLTFSEAKLDDALIEPVCQASLLRYTLAKTQGKNRLLFANPASTKREKMTVRLSYDEGATWPVAKELHAGPAAYSCLTVLGDGTIGCLYERGAKSAYETITFSRFTLEWLTAGKDS